MKSITIYSTTNCQYCHMAKDFLKERGVKFEDINLTENPDRAEELLDKSGQMGVPVLFIKDLNEKGEQIGETEMIIGFSKKRLSELFPITNPTPANDNEPPAQMPIAA